MLDMYMCVNIKNNNNSCNNYNYNNMENIESFIFVFVNWLWIVLINCEVYGCFLFFLRLLRCLMWFLKWIEFLFWRLLRCFFLNFFFSSDCIFFFVFLVILNFVLVICIVFSEFERVVLLFCKNICWSFLEIVLGFIFKSWLFGILKLFDFVILRVIFLIGFLNRFWFVFCLYDLKLIKFDREKFLDL